MNSKKYIFFTLIALVVVDCFRWISSVGALEVDFATYISIFLIYISIFFLSKIALNSNWKKETPISIQRLIKIWFVVNIINFIRGFFLSQDYWDYKYLFFTALSFSFIFLVFFIGNNLKYVKTVFKFVLKYLFPFGFLLVPLTLTTNEELYSRIMIPISLFILFIPFLKSKYKFLVIIVTFVSIFIVIGFRSNIIKIAFSVLLLVVYYFNISYRWLRIMNLSLLVIPIILFSVAVTGVFNIFSDISNSKDYQITTNANTGETLVGDTRTFLYVEVLKTINSTGNFLIGSGSTGSYQSDYFYDSGGAINGKRYGSEVGILNILLRFGIIGVGVYFLIIFKVSFTAINNSSNQLSKILGLYIAFRWLFSFIEEFTQYDLNFYFFWLAVGLVSSNSFRAMNDKEIKQFFLLR